MLTSARNHFVGQIAEIKTGAVSDEITLRTRGGLDIVAIVTNDSVERLGLAAGKSATAIFKASGVIVGVE
ncbi:molybdopterin-binding protein [Paraburkholderia sp. BL23I1N1]|nr:molybdopterin-binding protein [Paraburkholderia sp. BL23I1N1]